MFQKKILTLLFSIFWVTLAIGQFQHGIAINYLLRVDTSDLSGYDIEMHIRNAPKTFHVAMATHHEYDDGYWKFVENFRLQNQTPANNFIREDSALWRILVSNNTAIIKYRIHLPAYFQKQRPAWKPFLSSTGGLVGDMHSFMYVVEQPNTPSHITFKIPESWEIATGLRSTKNSKIFYAQNAQTLLDCPALIGKFESWKFTVRQIPHTIVYWPLPGAAQFNKLILVNNIKKITLQTIKLFDTIPYTDYTFLLQDGAYAALEHTNSVTIGIPAETFYRDTVDTNQEIAHEYFHAWNLMSLHPAEYSVLNYGPQEKAAGVWWSEGLSVFYADLLLRRAGLATYDTTRIGHLEKLIERYFSNPGNAKISPEKASLESNAQPGGLGDYNVSVHLQGEVAGAMIDFIIRDATGGKQTIDDAMRKLFNKYSGSKGFYSKNIEQAINNICKCDIHSFFENYIYNAGSMDFNRYLKLIGQQVNVTLKPATNANGKLSPDWQINIYHPAADTGFNILLFNPESCWAKSGLHTNDKVVSINDLPVLNTQTFRNIQRNLQVGDTVNFGVKRGPGIKKIMVIVTGYNEPVAQITFLKNASLKQRKLFADWIKTQ